MSKKSKDTDGAVQFSVPQRAPADRKKKLGKGLGALLGETKREEPLVRSTPADKSENPSVSTTYTSDSALQSIAIADIDPLPGNPRKHFNEDALDELAASIASRGVIQPIIVRPAKGGRYQLVAGERRWRAAQKAQLHTIPALVRALDNREVMALALIENLQREDLNPVEEARAYQRLTDDEGMTQAEIARMVEKSRSHIANLLRLLNLPSQVLDLVESGRLSMGHARALVGQEDAAELAQRAVNDNLSVREIEKLVRKVAAQLAPTGSSGANPAPKSGGDADIIAVQNHLEEFLGMPVRIKADADPRMGAVTIRYATLDQLDLVCQRLTGGDI